MSTLPLGYYWAVKIGRSNINSEAFRVPTTNMLDSDNYVNKQPEIGLCRSSGAMKKTLTNLSLILDSDEFGL